MRLKFKNIKVKGHSSFYLRDGWINKGLMNVDAFNSKHSVDQLGVGSTMVNAIRYYLLTMGLIEKFKDGRKMKYRLTENLGDKIYKFDKYLENNETLWLLHYKFISNVEDATSFSLFFNEFEYDEFTKEEVSNFINRYIKKQLPEKKYSEKSVESDVDCIINNYNINGNKRETTPEDNLNSPFVELGLIKKVDNSANRYEKIKPKMDKLSELVVMYVILDMLDGKDYISIDRLYNDSNSPRRIFNFDRYMLNQYLDKLEAENYIEINRTAGLDQVYIKFNDQEELLNRFYENRMEY